MIALVLIPPLAVALVFGFFLHQVTRERDAAREENDRLAAEVAEQIAKRFTAEWDADVLSRQLDASTTDLVNAHADLAKAQAAAENLNVGLEQVLDEVRRLTLDFVPQVAEVIEFPKASS